MPSYKINKPTCPEHPYNPLNGELGCVLCNGEDLAKRQKMRGTSNGKERAHRGSGGHTSAGTSGYENEDASENDSNLNIAVH